MVKKSNVKKAEVATVEAPEVKGQEGGNAAPALKGPRYAKSFWAKNWVITNVVPNTKRGKSQVRFDLLRNGMTVQEYCDAVVQHGLGTTTLAQADLRWGIPRGQFTIEAPAE